MKILLILPAALLLYSCGMGMFSEVTCRDFTQTDDLRFFAGNEGDSTVFRSGEKRKRFFLEKKFIFHRTKYISDTGCGCLDRWGSFFTNETDTISIYSDERYVYNNTANRTEELQMFIDGKMSGFITEDARILENFELEGKIFGKVRVLEYLHADPLQFRRVHVAHDYGIIRMERVNGEVWINEDLTDTRPTDRSTFDYQETTCQ